MALDPSIGLQVALPKAVDPIEQYTKGIQLKQLINQQQQQAQLQPLQLQEAQTSLQNARLQQEVLAKNAAAAERAQADQANLIKAHQDSRSYKPSTTGGAPAFDWDMFEENAANNFNVSPGAILDARKQKDAAIEQTAKTHLSILAAEKQNHETVRDALYGVSDPETWQARLNKLHDVGAINDTERTALEKAGYSPENVKRFTQAYSTKTQMIAEAEESNKQQAAAAELRGKRIANVSAARTAGLKPSAEDLEGAEALPPVALQDYKDRIDRLAGGNPDNAEISRIAKQQLDDSYATPGENTQVVAKKVYDKAVEDMIAMDKAKRNKQNQINITTAADQAIMAGLPDVMTEKPSQTPNPATGKSLGNTPFPKIGQTPNSIWDNAIRLAVTGQMPPMGLGAKGTPLVVRTALMNQAAAQAEASGTDLPTLQAEYKANSVALSRLVPLYRATAAYAYTAQENLNLALNQSPKVRRTESPIVNRYVNWANGETLVGNPELTRLETYIYTAAREYAKVTSGGALSAQGLTDSAAREATKLINAAQTPSAFAAAIDAMKNDMGNVTKGQENQIAATSSTISNFLETTSGLDATKGTAPIAPKPAGQTPPAPGQQSPPLPTHPTATDIGSVFWSASRQKNVRITAINPQNPLQFRVEEVK